MSNLVKVNNTCTQLLTYINNKSLTYIKERNLSKINGETAEKLLSKYGPYEVKIDNPIIKKYDTFELIQFKNADSIINIISLSAKDDYKI